MSRLSRATFAGALLGVVALSGGVSLGQTAAPRLKEAMTAADFERCGLQKLTAAELTALETWLAGAGQRFGGKTPATVTSSTATAASPTRAGESVAFNTANGKYHCLSCQWAARCTRNCVTIPLSDARARGVACKVCGGSCR